MPKQRYFAVSILALSGIVLSLILFVLVHNWEQQNLRMEFESQAQGYANAVQNNLNQYVGALMFLGDFFNNSSHVTRHEFANFVDSALPRYPGVQAFSWNPLVFDEERMLYESSARTEGVQDFQFTERSADKQLIKAASRPEYVIVYYIKPLATNKQALGYDIASEPTRLKAINRGFDTGELVATEKIILVQETGNQYGILLLLPIYKQGASLRTAAERHASRKGFVVEVLRIGDVVETAIKGFAGDRINMTLFDMSAEEGKRFLYHRSAYISEINEQITMEEATRKEFYWSKAFEFGGRQWKMVFYPASSYLDARSLWQSWIVVIVALALTCMLAFYVFKKNIYTAEIEQRVRKQAQTNQQLETEIYERVAAEADRDRTIRELKQALDEVKTLRGILPLCSFCKKIRDDKGYWEQVDVYIHKHSQADISHSICPDCLKQHYPEENAKLFPDKK